MKEFSDKLIALYEEYVDGKIHREQLLHDNGEPLSDDELEALKADYDLVQRLLVLDGLREDLEQIHQSFEQQKKPASIKKLRVWWRIAASIALIATVTFFLNRFNSSQETYEDYFEPYQNLISVRGEVPTTLAKAMRFYSAGRYDSAQYVFERIELDTINYDLLFYRAQNAMALKKFDKAISDFQEIGPTQENPYWQQTRWFRALTQWQLGNTSVALTLLKSIQTGEYKFEEAQRLIRLLESEQ